MSKDLELDHSYVDSQGLPVYDHDELAVAHQNFLSSDDYQRLSFAQYVSVRWGRNAGNGLYPTYGELKQPGLVETPSTTTTAALVKEFDAQTQQYASPLAAFLPDLSSLIAGASTSPEIKQQKQQQHHQPSSPTLMDMEISETSSSTTAVAAAVNNNITKASENSFEAELANYLQQASPRVSSSNTATAAISSTLAPAAPLSSLDGNNDDLASTLLAAPMQPRALEVVHPTRSLSKQWLAESPIVWSRTPIVAAAATAAAPKTDAVPVALLVDVGAPLASAKKPKKKAMEIESWGQVVPALRAMVSSLQAVVKTESDSGINEHHAGETLQRQLGLHGAHLRQQLSKDTKQRATVTAVVHTMLQSVMLHQKHHFNTQDTLRMLKACSKVLPRPTEAIESLQESMRMLPTSGAAFQLEQRALESSRALLKAVAPEGMHTNDLRDIEAWVAAAGRDKATFEQMKLGMQLLSEAVGLRDFHPTHKVSLSRSIRHFMARTRVSTVCM